MNQNEMLAEIAKALRTVPAKDGAAGVTAREYAKARGVGTVKARDELRLLQSQGKLRVSFVATQPTPENGYLRAVTVPVYSPVNGKK